MFTVYVPGDIESCHGLYIRAFCKGLEQVLEPYRHKLLILEQELLSDPHLTIGYVQSSLDEYQELFPVLTAVIRHIETHKVHRDTPKILYCDKPMDSFIRLSYYWGMFCYKYT